MEKIGRSLERVLEHSGLGERAKHYQKMQHWNRVVGEKIARHARPVAMKNKKLLVEVSDSIWLYHLTALKTKIISEFNSCESEHGGITDIKFINADFTSMDRETAAGISLSARSAGISLDLENTPFPERPGLEEKEKEKLQGMLREVPDSLRFNVLRLAERCSAMRSWMQESGCQSCRLCAVPFMARRMVSGFCPACRGRVESWTRVVARCLRRSPWLKAEELKPVFPALDAYIFAACKETILEKYRRRIRKAASREHRSPQLQERVLRRLVQRYVMMVEEKDPSQIEAEHLFNALKFYPGLYQRQIDVKKF